MEAAEVVRQLAEISDKPLPLKESHAATLMKLPVAQRQEVWADIVTDCQRRNQPITARVIQEKIQELRLDRPAPAAFDNEPATREVLLSRVREAFRNANSREVMVQVSGNWLIRNGLAEIWKRLRNMDKRMIITEKYKDYITLDQAEQLGLVQRM
ncbi:MAG: hypothetical protein LH606_21335 [Cytophagaceae bacterium]|nr:hypothetical protein [Cytophagaceae bacterium]